MCAIRIFRRIFRHFITEEKNLVEAKLPATLDKVIWSQKKAILIKKDRQLAQKKAAST